MSTTGSAVVSYNAGDVTVSSLALGTNAAFATTFAANQVGILEAVLFVSLPANHGGFMLNWLMPAGWPFSRIRDDWRVSEVGADAFEYGIPTPGINDPSHNDVVVIARPDARARILRIRGSAQFKAPAAGGVINLQGALAGSGASVTVQAGSQVEARLY